MLKIAESFSLGTIRSTTVQKFMKILDGKMTPKSPSPRINLSECFDWYKKNVRSYYLREST